MDKDLEKNESPAGPPQYDYGSTADTKEGTKFSLFVDSFRRNPNARMATEATDAEGKPLPDQPPAEPALAMKLKDRHLQMIAIGGSIGTKCLLYPKVLASRNQINTDRWSSQELVYSLVPGPLLHRVVPRPSSSPTVSLE